VRSERGDGEQESRVLIGNEAGRYLASLIRAHLAGVDDEKVVPWRTVRELLAGWADDIEAKAQGSDEQVAYEKGRQAAFAEARKAVEGKRVVAMESAAESRKQVVGPLDDAVTRGMTNALAIAFDASLAALDALATPPDTGTPE
jgi:hypothetical protein